MSHISKTINSAKRIRLRGEKSDSSANLIVGEREKRKKEIQSFFLRSTEIRWSEFVEPRIKVYLLDKGYSYVPESKIQKIKFGKIEGFGLMKGS